MFLQLLFATILNYSEITLYKCLLHISDNVNIKETFTSNLQHIILSPDKNLTRSDVHIWDQCPNIVISSKNPRQTFEKYEYFLWKFGEDMFIRKYFIRIQENQHSLLDEFFNSSALHNVADLLIFKEFDDRCEIYTHRYVGRVDNNRPILLDVFFSNGTFLNNVNLLKSKLTNVYGRILNVGAAKYLPLSDPVRMLGSETMFLLEYVRHFNYTLNFDKREVRLGLLYPNKTVTGFTKLMLQDQLDLISYGLYIQPTRTFFGAFSYPMSEISLTLIVPKPSVMDEWTIIYILRPYTWLTMAFSYVVSVLVFDLILKLRQSPTDKNKPESTVFVVFRLFMGQAHFAFIQQKDRILMGTLLSLMIIIHTYFTSKLASFNTVPLYKDEIQTISDMAEYRLPWYTTYYDEIKSLETAKTDPLFTLYQTFLNTTPQEFEVMINVPGPKNFAFAIDQSFNSKYYTIFDYFKIDNLQHFQIIRDYIIRHQYTAFFLRRNSVLMPSVNKYWSWAAQHGFAIQWEIDAMRGQQLLIQTYLQNSHQRVVTAQAMNAGDFLGIFLILGVGYGVSIFAFAMEVLWARVNRKRFV